MRSFEIFVEPEPQAPTAWIGANDETAPGASPARSTSPRSGTRLRPNEVLDLFIHGANVTARVSERHASCVLRDLAVALGELAKAPRGKRIVRFYDDAWELCVERLGAGATLSVYRGGAEPTVLVYDRPVVFAEMCASVVEAIDTALARSNDDARDVVLRDLASVRGALTGAAAPLSALDDELVAVTASPVMIELD